MSDAAQKTCPYCQTPIQPGEQVVFCSACAIPHHRECWEESQGCTTFGCRGAASSVEPDRPRPAETVNIMVGPKTASGYHCPFCEESVDKWAVQCQNCGRILPDEGTTLVIEEHVFAAPTAPPPVNPYGGAPNNPYMMPGNPYMTPTNTYIAPTSPYMAPINPYKAQAAAAADPFAAPYPGLPYQGMAMATYAKAPFGARLVAWIIDNWLLPGIFISPLIAGIVLDNKGLLFFSFFTIPLTIWYNFTKDGWGEGQSMGKKLVGLMVMNLDSGMPCSKGSSALRAVMWFVPYVSSLVLLVDFVLALVDEKGRRIGDHLAHTQVVSIYDYNYYRR